MGGEKVSENAFVLRTTLQLIFRKRSEMFLFFFFLQFFVCKLKGLFCDRKLLRSLNMI